MLKVMDTYRKGVEYFNSYGLDENKNTNPSKHKKITGTGSFWDLN